MARFLVSRPILSADTKDLASMGRAMRNAAAEIEAECKEEVWEAALFVVERAKQNVSRRIPPEGGSVRRSSHAAAGGYADEGGSSTIYGGTQVSEAKGYSERIPPTIHAVRTRGLQVFVRAGGPSAPHAKAIENHGDGFVSHYTFGGLPYTKKNSRPAYLQPALEVGAIKLEIRTKAAVMRGLEQALERRW